MNLNWLSSFGSEQFENSLSQVRCRDIFSFFKQPELPTHQRSNGGVDIVASLTRNKNFIAQFTQETPPALTSNFSCLSNYPKLNPFVS